MKERLVKLYRRNKLWKSLLSVPSGVYKIIIGCVLSDEAWYRQMFLLAHGYALELNEPRTLNEKIQWLMLNNRKEYLTQWADKFKVRDYIRDILGEQYLIPLLAVAKDPYEIDFSVLPEPFIIKPTHSSGLTIVVRDKSKMDWNSVAKQCSNWLRPHRFCKDREWHYRTIPPKIVVEKLLIDENGNIPFDYKFHCIHGKIEAIQVDIDRQTNHRRNLYDLNWKRLPFVWSICAGDKPLWPQGREVKKPDVLSELIIVTKRIAKIFPYARIDWYIVMNRIYFGEVTFHHGGGYERILPFGWDRKLGDKLHLPFQQKSLESLHEVQ